MERKFALGDRHMMQCVGGVLLTCSVEPEWFWEPMSPQHTQLQIN